MNGTTTRARAGTSTQGRRGATVARPRQDTDRAAGPRYDAPYSYGANALQIGYADPVPELAPVSAPPASPARKRVTRGPASAPAEQHRPATQALPFALPKAPFLVLVLSIVVVGVLGVLLLNTKINENSFRLDALQRDQAALDLQEQQVSQALADRESPGNLRAAAKRLGLVPAGTPAFIRLPDGRVVGVPTPAQGE